MDMAVNTTVLAIADDGAAMLSLVGQIGSMVFALLIGRFALKTRSEIWAVAFAGAIVAMIAHMVFDGQAAFLLLIYAPVIYFMATVGRRNLA